MTESMLMLPLFFLCAFGLLQGAQLGIAVIAAKYAASSVARKAANEQTFIILTGAMQAPVSLSKYDAKAKALMVGGMQWNVMQGCINKDPTSPTGDLWVNVQATLPAWPFFGDLLHQALGTKFDAQTLMCPDLANTTGFGPFNFSAQAPYTFYVNGNARVRLNYMQ